MNHGRWAGVCGTGSAARWCLPFLVGVGTVFGAGPAGAPARLVTAVAIFENPTPDPQAVHWGFGFALLLQHHLREVKGLRLLPLETATWALRELGVEPGEALSLARARQLGERVEARRVVWGVIRRESARWRVTARVLNAATGQASEKCEATGADWFDVGDQIGRQLLAALGVNLSGEERARLARRPTVSPLAWEWFGRAWALDAGRKPWSELEAALRKALEADPQFVEAHVRLGAVLARQGQGEPALAALRRALEIQPDHVGARTELGLIHLWAERFRDAEKELLEARRLDPEEARVPLRLGELCLAQDKVDEAVDWWRQALRLDPACAPAHAHLGQALARKGQRALALMELREAARWAGEDDAVEETLCEAFEALHESEAALQHGRRFLALARKRGGNPALVRQFEERVRRIEATLTPHPVEAVPPPSHTAESLQAALRARLTEEELKLVPDPLAATPEMERVAETMTLGARTDLERVRKLFDALAGRVDPGLGGSRTAREVFAGWNNPQLSFRCQEYARFFVALARAVGVQAFFTSVDEDCHGRQVLHACACVFADGRAWLVDPSYRWFGAPHRRFEVLDDVAATASYLQQQHRDLARQRLAVKLQPDSAAMHLNLAMALTSAGRLNEARLELETGLRLEPNTWQAYCAQGYFAGAQGEWVRAAEFLRRAVVVNPDCDKAHFFLAEALRTQGHLREAREAYRTYLRTRLDAEFVEAARRAIARINEKLGDE